MEEIHDHETASQRGYCEKDEVLKVDSHSHSHFLFPSLQGLTASSWSIALWLT